MKNNILNRLKKEAEAHSPVFGVRIVAAVIHKGKIVAIGKNQDKTHPQAALYSKHAEAIYLHAEVDAINKAKKQLDNLSRTELYVLRIKQDGTFGLSLPCEGCSNCIVYNNISKVIYSKDNGEMKCISL